MCFIKNIVDRHTVKIVVFANWIKTTNLNAFVNRVSPDINAKQVDFFGKQ